MSVTRAMLTLLVVTAIAYAARSFLPSGATVTGSGAALALGFLIIASMQVAHMADAVKLPRLTGYLLCGLLFGPEVLAIVSEPMLGDLTLIKGTAVGLIALLAGCELNFRRLRPKLRAIGAISISTIVLTFVLLLPIFYWIVSVVPITAGYTLFEKLAVAAVCANVMAAFSPSVVIGVISETGARGPLSELSMSIVVIADLAIVLSFSLTSMGARSLFPSAQTMGGVEALFVHIFGSIAIGIVFGIVLTIYVRRVRSHTGLFVVAMLFVAAEAGRAMHLDPLLIGLAAGLFLENISPVSGEDVVKAIEVAALPTFAIFFAVIGAELQLQAFLHVAPFAVAAAFVRAIGIYAGTWIAVRAGGLDRTTGALVPHGLLSQAGVAIALAILILNDFKPWGRVFGTILLGSIVVNQLIGPVLFRYALAKAGEIGAAPPDELSTPLEEPA
jgi:Kef-type K+ transport system membrane component KefB